MDPFIGVLLLLKWNGHKYYNKSIKNLLLFVNNSYKLRIIDLK